jgi:hypothetical protein
MEIISLSGKGAFDRENSYKCPLKVLEKNTHREALVRYLDRTQSATEHVI